MLLRSRLQKDWPKYLQTVTTSLNSRKLPSLGGLRPEEVKGSINDPIVDQYKKKIGKKIFDITYKEKIANQKQYENDLSKLQSGDYVYAALRDNSHYKSFDIQVLYRTLLIYIYIKQ